MVQPARRGREEVIGNYFQNNSVICVRNAKFDDFHDRSRSGFEAPQPLEARPCSRLESGAIPDSLLRLLPGFGQWVTGTREKSHAVGWLAVKIGLTLPQFNADARAMVAAAQRAEAEGIDAVFAYDHYPKPERPEAQHGLTMLGALAVATDRIEIGPLVARIGVVPDRVLLSQLHTLGRLAGAERVLCGLGIGDRQSDSEDIALGIERPSLDERVARLEFVASTLKNEFGLTVWIGGRSRRAEAVAVDLGVSRNLWDADRRPDRRSGRRRRW